jgi:hypothetical protein
MAESFFAGNLASPEKQRVESKRWAIGASAHKLLLTVNDPSPDVVTTARAKSASTIERRPAKTLSPPGGEGLKSYRRFSENQTVFVVYNA